MMHQKLRPVMGLVSHAMPFAQKCITSLFARPEVFGPGKLTSTIGAMASPVRPCLRATR